MKTNTTSNYKASKPSLSKPFFNKSGEQRFFSPSEEIETPFFVPNPIQSNVISGSNPSNIIQKDGGEPDQEEQGLLEEYEGWSEQELITDISGNLYNSINEVQNIRIDSWLQNVGIEETRPGALVLGVALDILAAGIGRSLGGVISRAINGAIASKITQDFIAGLVGKSISMVLDTATDGLNDLVNPSGQDSSGAATRGVAITAEKGLPEYYTEGTRLLLLDAKTSQSSDFTRSSSEYDRHELIIMHSGLRETYERLRDDPESFMQNLTVGYMSLLDELYINEQAEDYEGSTDEERRENMYRRDDEISETTTRSGNVLIVGPLTSIGTWNSPHFTIRSAIVSDLNESTREHLAGAKIDDLPMSLAFRFWGTTPNPGILGSILCKVWFVKRPDGTIAVDLDESWERDSGGYDQGREWLARYGTGNSGEMSQSEIEDNVAVGARRAYNQVKNMVIPRGVLNLDMF